MYSFIVMKKYCIGTSLGSKLLTLHSSFKVCPKYNNLPANNILHRRVSTEIDIQRLRNVNTQFRPLLNIKHLQQNISKRCLNEKKKLDVNTNVKNDVLLYKCTNPAMPIIRISMHVYILIWAATVSCALYMNMKQQEKVSFQQMVNDLITTSPVDIILYVSGPVLYLVGWIYVGRMMKMIILRKGGEKVSIVTHHVLSKERCITYPTSKVHCQLAPTTQIPSALKIKDHYGYYMFDARGEYMNRTLFDHTVVPMKV